MDRQCVPRHIDAKGIDFYGTPLSSSPFPPPPNSFVPRHALPPHFVSPPGPMDASPLCRPPPVEGFRYRSPMHSPSIPISPYGSRSPFSNSPFGVFAPNASFGPPSSGSSYGDHSSAGNFRQGGHKSWNGTPSNGHELRRGMKRSNPTFRQVGFFTVAVSPSPNVGLLFPRSPKVTRLQPTFFSSLETIQHMIEYTFILPYGTV